MSFLERHFTQYACMISPPFLLSFVKYGFPMGYLLETSHTLELLHRV
jgi:hypothetical protein